MRNWIKIASALLLSLLALVGCARRKQPETLRANSKDLPNTQITPHLEEKIVPGKNLIYCSTFQLAWNELRDNIVKEDIRLENEPPTVEVLNKKPFTEVDISSESYVAMAGFGKDNIVKKVNEALKSKFRRNAPSVQEEVGPAHILAYAFLLKDLRFSTPFENLSDFFFLEAGSGGVEVEAFGIKEYEPRKRKHRKLGRQARILAYDYRTGECVVRLISTSPKDEIILARVRPRETLLSTVRSVQERIKSGKATPLPESVTLQVPKFDFDLTHSYSELINKFLLNNGFKDYYIARARQDIRFRLNEKGAVLKSEAELEAVSVVERPVFNEPFLLYLKEKEGEYPYLAIWVDNAEILLKH